MVTTNKPTTDRAASPRTASLTSGAAAGVVGGLAGGVIFGAMMQAMGMMPMVAGLMGSSSIAVGWVVHLAISAFFGAVFGVVAASLLSGLARGALLGAGYGVVLWIVGPLLLMPARMGMPLFSVNEMTLNSLIGHLVFGAVLGAVAGAMLGRRSVSA